MTTASTLESPRHSEYLACIVHSEKVTWALSDIFPEDASLDFGRRFLPEGLCGTLQISCLSDVERLVLNQIRGFSYCHLFQFCEEYIIALAMQHAQAAVYGDEAVLRGMLRFAEEEVKHQQVFKRMCDMFRADFGTPCDAIENAEAVAGIVLGKHPIAALIMTIHLEMESQHHYAEGVRDALPDRFDPVFRRMLSHHWREEAQHVKLDKLELEALVEQASPESIDTALVDYLGLIDAFDGMLRKQAAMDVASLQKHVGRTFSEAELAEITDVTVRTSLKTWLRLGLKNRMLDNYLYELSPERHAQWRAKLTALPTLESDA